MRRRFLAVRKSSNSLYQSRYICPSQPKCGEDSSSFLISPSRGGVELQWVDGRSRWPAALLSGFGAPWNTLKLDGILDISTQGFKMRFDGARLLVDGRAALAATDMSSSLSTLRPNLRTGHSRPSASTAYSISRQSRFWRFPNSAFSAANCSE